MKFLVLLFYYERPKMLRNALNSVKGSTYKNWDLCVIDDGTEHPAIDVLNECFEKNERIQHRISCIQTMDPQERKALRGGSQFGLYANAAIEASDADLVLMLCDDDVLIDDYMERLNDFYTSNPQTNYSYCHLKFYDPLNGQNNEENSVSDGYTKYLNSRSHPINPVRRVDSSQVSWRRSRWMEDGIRFPHPRTSNLDEAIFAQMHSVWGDCEFNGTVGQWKGIHRDQLINLSRKKG